MSTLTRFVKGSGWAFIGRIGSLALGLVSSVLLARVLSPADFGAYILLLTIARVAMLVSQVGMNQVVVRFIAKYLALGFPDKARNVVIKSFQITLVSSCVVGAIYFVASSPIYINFFKLPTMSTVNILVVAWIIAGALRLLAAECFRGFHDLIAASIFELFVFELFFVILIYSIWTLHGEISFHDVVLFSMITAFISLFPAIFVLLKKIYILPLGQLESYSALLNTGWPLLVSNLVFVLTSQVGLWVVGIVSTPADVALYASAFRLVLLMQLPLLILNSVVPQLIAELHVSGKRSQIQGSLQLIATAGFIPTILCYLIFLFFGGSLLTLIFGDFYRVGNLILKILGFGVLFNAFVGFCGPALMMTGHQKSLMKISLFCGFFSLVFSFPIGLRFGAEGVAVVMSMVNVLQHLFMLLVVKRKIGVWTMVGNFSGIKKGFFSIVRQ